MVPKYNNQNNILKMNDYKFDIAELDDDDIKYITRRMEKEVPEELHKIRKRFDYLFEKRRDNAKGYKGKRNNSERYHGRASSN